MAINQYLPVGMSGPQTLLPAQTQQPALGSYGQQAQALFQNPQLLGQYGLQAHQLAGLLGGFGGQIPTQGQPPYTPGPFLPQAYPNGAGGGGPFVPTHRYTTRSK